MMSLAHLPEVILETELAATIDAIARASRAIAIAMASFLASSIEPPEQKALLGDAPWIFWKFILGVLGAPDAQIPRDRALALDRRVTARKETDHESIARKNPTDAALHRGPSLVIVAAVYVVLFIASIVVPTVMAGGQHFPFPLGRRTRPAATSGSARAPSSSRLSCSSARRSRSASSRRAHRAESSFSG